MPTSGNKSIVVESPIYPGGVQYDNSPSHKGANNISTILSQVIGRGTDSQPSPIEGIGGGLVTSPGLYGQMGTIFIYYVRGADTGSLEFVEGSQGRVKKVVTIPSNSTSTDIIRVTVFFYQNPSFPTRVTSITDYEELRSFYEIDNVLKYDVNSSTQNNINPNQ